MRPAITFLVFNCQTPESILLFYNITHAVHKQSFPLKSALLFDISSINRGKI